jgi:GTPase
MLGVLTKGVLDDGKGKARLNLFRHKHEIESGRTSSVGGEILGFDSLSKSVPAVRNGKKLSWDEVCQSAAKVISFTDLAGHEKYLKVSFFTCSPDLSINQRFFFFFFFLDYRVWYDRKCT